LGLGGQGSNFTAPQIAVNVAHKASAVKNNVGLKPAAKFELKIE